MIRHVLSCLVVGVFLTHALADQATKEASDLDQRIERLSKHGIIVNNWPGPSYSIEIRGERRLSDAVLEELAHFRQLTYLIIDGGFGSRVSDVGWNRLKNIGVTHLHLRLLKLPANCFEVIGTMQRVQQMWLDDVPATDEDLVHFAGHIDLKDLRLSNARLTGDGLAHLVTLRALTDLSLSDCPLTDRGFEKIAPLARHRTLERLSLWGTPVTHASMPTVAKFRSLKRLSLDKTKINDAGLIHLGELTKLEALSVAGTGVTGEGLIHLKGLAKLKQLSLRGCPLKDEHLAHLTALSAHPTIDMTGTAIGDKALVHIIAYHSRKELETTAKLDLSGTQVTDAGLKELKLWPDLKAVHLDGTKVTEDALRTFSFEYPEVRFYYSRSPRFRRFLEQRGFFKAGFALPTRIGYDDRSLVKAYQQHRERWNLPFDKELDRLVQPGPDWRDGEKSGK